MSTSPLLGSSTLNTPPWNKSLILFMYKIILRKICFASLSLFALLMITFVLMKFIPGDPFMQEQALPEELYQSLKNFHGLNDPLWKQFMQYVSQLIRLDFGNSGIHQGMSVKEMILSGLPASATLCAESLLIAFPCGILLGIYAALKKNSWQDRSILIIATIGISLPSFIIATLLQYGLGIGLGLLPIARWGSFDQSIMPAIALAAQPMAFIARLTRAKMRRELSMPYVQAARAKGLSETKIIFSHILRNILPPILSYLGPLIAAVMTGSFVIEKIFSIPGLGYWFVNSVLNRDYPLIMGITVFYGALLLLAAMIVDIVCLMLDPRAKHVEKLKKEMA